MLIGPGTILPPGTILSGFPFPKGGAILVGGVFLFFTDMFFPNGTKVPHQLPNGFCRHAGGHLVDGTIVPPGTISPQGILCAESIPGLRNPIEPTTQHPRGHRRNQSNPVPYGGFPSANGTVFVGNGVAHPIAGTMVQIGFGMGTFQPQYNICLSASRNSSVQPDISGMQAMMAQMSLANIAQARLQVQAMSIPNVQPHQHASAPFPASGGQSGLYRQSSSIPTQASMPPSNAGTFHPQATAHQFKPAPSTLNANQGKPAPGTQAHQNLVSSQYLGSDSKRATADSHRSALSTSTASTKTTKARKGKDRDFAHYSKESNVKKAFKFAMKYGKNPEEHLDDIEDLKSNMECLRDEIKAKQTQASQENDDELKKTCNGKLLFVSLILKLLSSPSSDLKTTMSNFALFDDATVAISFLWVVFSDKDSDGMGMLDWAKLLGLTSLPKMRAVPLQKQRDIVHALKGREIGSSCEFHNNKTILVKAGVLTEAWSPRCDKRANPKVMAETFVAMLGGHFLMKDLSKGGLTFDFKKGTKPYTTDLQEPLSVLLHRAEKSTRIALPNRDGFEIGEEATSVSKSKEESSPSPVPESGDAQVSPTSVDSNSNKASKPAVFTSGDDQKPPAVPDVCGSNVPRSEEEKKEGDSDSVDGDSDDDNEHLVI